MSIENTQIPEAEQIKKPDPSFEEGLSPEMRQKMDRFDRAMNLGLMVVKKWLKDKKGVEFTVEQEEEFNKVYQTSFALSSLAM